MTSEKWRVSFGGNAVEVHCKPEDLKEPVRFLLRDTHNEDNPVQTRFRLKKKDTEFQVWRNGRRFYQSETPGNLVTWLAGEIIYHLIDNNSESIILHAACLERNGKAVLIPGVSGAGKSSLSAWLASNGFRYLTDELVCYLPGKSAVEAFTRPLNIKHHGLEVIRKQVLGPEKEPAMLKGNISTLISHREFNPDFIDQRPNVAAILFPRFSASADYQLNQISSAKTALLLMQVFVNARNHEAHGFSYITELARQVRGLQLDYSGFDQLNEVHEMLMEITGS